MTESRVHDPEIPAVRSTCEFPTLKCATTATVGQQ